LPHVRKIAGRPTTSLARLDANDVPSLYGTTGSFLLGVDAQQAAQLTSSGTWLSSLLRASGHLRHIYIDE
jgi:hypothetical protein